MADTPGTALITGASSGIGAALAKVCARHGHPLVLVARSQQRLEELAAELRDRDHVSVTVVLQDLAAPGAADALVAELGRRSIEVEILINNAGFGTHGLFAQAEPASQVEMLHVNVVSLTQLTRLLLPGMLRRRRGRVLNVASTAAFQPGPLMAVYYASKAYVLSFSEALSNELAGSGVCVTALCPGPTRSEFQQRAGIEHIRLLRRGVMEAVDVAEAGYRGLMAGERVVIPGIRNKALALAARLAPRALTLRIVRGLQEQRSAVE